MSSQSNNLNNKRSYKQREYKHFTLESATTEAKRLAAVSGKEVYILDALTCIKLNKYIIENCEETTDNPF